MTTPNSEQTNPFASLGEAVGSTLSPDSTLKHEHQTTHTGTNPQSSRFARKSPMLRQRSLSANRRADSESLYNHPAWHTEPNPHANGGLHNAVRSVGSRIRRRLWVGTLGTHTDSFKDNLKRSIDKRMFEKVESVPVWIPDAEFEKCYDEFCHQAPPISFHSLSETNRAFQVLWPALHYAIPDAPKTKSFYESASWTQYQSVNQRFADVIIANYREGDISAYASLPSVVIFTCFPVWVNDYHLMLLPAMIRKKHPNAAIGFFLHVAFPSSEIFRCLSVREHLLNGLLASDLVAFQTPNFARHFRSSFSSRVHRCIANILFRQTVSRILALEALPKGIQTEERFVDVAAIPMGIDVAALSEKRWAALSQKLAMLLNAVRRNPEVAHWVQVLRQRYAGMKLIVGRDKLDEVQVGAAPACPTYGF